MARQSPDTDIEERADANAKDEKSYENHELRIMNYELRI